ncbi:RsbT co-antagonist protein RsbRA [Terribacillus saccharophilus]|uniref:RsbR protein n=1 Tax=Terribacillus saccharophilus TaxID=361277 RepID=A0A075LGG7_9BACI|nr:MULTISPECIES: RsbT co-antagonist protein RsbRA [Terribacillus]AIF65524.1 RsbR protein [Terribacillus goriensis]MCM3227685.1 RsbT co-antagonist protein RsbRA [Terribacillus saccharophilus]MEC0284049.1 RsbT co-antagonist protein RsbRA [Terribacillus saccharophilus]MEC0289595.1 RsbT co-antagonist protein RsbRA [Terribacillus saccharophilus]MEC0302404.1 RsbT co-antagonist protein RsbRA [Terribacillus saccharophilus]
MAKNLKEILVDNSNDLVHMWLEEVAEKQKEVTNSAISQDLFENTNREFVNIIFGSVEKESLTSDLDSFTERVINLGWPLSYLTDGLQLFKRVAIEFLIEHEELDVSVPKVLRHVDELVNPIINQLVNEYSGSWENTVSLQRVALQELSAPLIPVMDNITVMPLIGTIDTERAKFIMENLLDGVIKHHAEVVLIDITGVPVVDTMVAHHIIQAAEAVRLIGSTCILVGIRPEIAQTIVNLGIDLSKFPTKSSLRKGFTTALEMTNQMIVQTNSEEQTIEELIDSLDRSEQS